MQWLLLLLILASRTVVRIWRRISLGRRGCRSGIAACVEGGDEFEGWGRVSKEIFEVIGTCIFGETG